MGVAEYYWTQDQIDRAAIPMQWINENANTVTAELFQQGIPESPTEAIHITFSGWMKDYQEFKNFGLDKKRR